MAASYDIDELEDAIIDALEPLKADGDIKLKTLETYQGQLETEAEIERVARLFPAVFVIYSGSQFLPHGARKIERMTFVVFVCAQNLRDNPAARRGSSTKPGSYALLTAVRDKLYASQLGLNISPLALLRTRNVWFGKGLSVYAQEWETDVYHLFDDAA